MWKWIVAGIVLTVLFWLAVAAVIGEAVKETAACHPGVITVEKNGQKQTTLGCTNQQGKQDRG